MASRHQVDTSVTFKKDATQPATREIEIADVHPVPKTNPPRAKVAREAYISGDDLAKVVNLAIALGRPLLLQGDPGCGKTRLAYAVAYALGLPIEECYIKSTTKAQDLLYSYDAVTRLYDAQLDGRSRDAKRNGQVTDIKRYIRFGPLGRAIIRASYGRRSVVLIDEIDKADLDFPNDLLRELDRLEFEVAEAPQMRYAASRDRPALRPIIFVTHNEEKALPTAFLRRCVFHYVEFPKTTPALDAILGEHAIKDPKLRAKAIEVVNRLRQRDLLKKPGLSELLDWVGYLQAARVKPAELDRLPAAQALLKSVADLRQGQEEFAPTTRA
jgi:MoxR-like ATPase